MAEEKSPQPEAEVAEVKSPSSNPNAGESGTPAASIENTPSSDEQQATDFPSANAPDPTAANPEVNPNATGDKPTAVGEKPAAKKPAAAAKAKKEKPPAPEDKPFNEFIEQEYLPALKSALAEQGVKDLEVTFVKDKIQISGLSQNGGCWQVRGNWQSGQRQFSVYFPDEDINKQKAFSCATNGAKASILESFMIDERKVTLDLLVFYTIQRLNAQKWLAWN
ncbi:DUF2996 domain-containing protein [Allocoleopsis franciscana]|uniref:DUF2996 domain-containing protein n=1 Tax=Allocoleopsis franciscana PCC 7113 TaxID=1173027 RepID=K9WME1_9CYAN|nr:DUF2996 domain-containing protein [Allocoleopsis franciscana]AFZ20971.1 Protein of unknown function (DUF2996) [Allocoleopsis franciscana PCC 7113]